MGGGLLLGLVPLCLKRAGLTLVAVAPRAEARFEIAESVLTVSNGLPIGVLVLARGAGGAMLNGEIVEGSKSRVPCEGGYSA